MSFRLSLGSHPKCAVSSWSIVRPRGRGSLPRLPRAMSCIRRISSDATSRLSVRAPRPGSRSSPARSGHATIEDDRQKAGYTALAEGAKVSFDVVPNRGKESAENLKIR
jgi:hypothetical protein